VYSRDPHTEKKQPSTNRKIHIIMSSYIRLLKSCQTQLKQHANVKSSKCNIAEKLLRVFV